MICGKYVLPAHTGNAYHQNDRKLFLAPSIVKFTLACSESFLTKLQLKLDATRLVCSFYIWIGSCALPLSWAVGIAKLPLLCSGIIYPRTKHILLYGTRLGRKPPSPPSQSPVAKILPGKGCCWASGGRSRPLRCSFLFCKELSERRCGIPQGFLVMKCRRT